MCYLLEVGIPKAKASIIDTVSTRQITADRDSVSKLSAHLPGDFVSFRLSSSGCACDLYNGSRGQKRDVAKEHERYKKKGWSEAKIERALKDSRQDNHPASFRSDLKELLDALVNETSKLYILVYWSDDDVTGTKPIEKSAFWEARTPVIENEIVCVG